MKIPNKHKDDELALQTINSYITQQERRIKRLEKIISYKEKRLKEERKELKTLKKYKDNLAKDIEK